MSLVSLVSPVSLVSLVSPVSLVSLVSSVSIGSAVSPLFEELQAVKSKSQHDILHNFVNAGYDTLIEDDVPEAIGNIPKHVCQLFKSH